MHAIQLSSQMQIKQNNKKYNSTLQKYTFKESIPAE